MVLSRAIYLVQQETTITADRTLRFAAALYLVAWGVHNADHIRRGIGVITPEVFAGGLVTGILALVAIALVFMRHPLAPLLAALDGVIEASGVSAAHLLPHWSALSDSFPNGHVDGWSWFAVLFEVSTALVFAAAGFTVWRRQEAGMITAWSPSPNRRFTSTRQPTASTT